MNLGHARSKVSSNPCLKYLGTNYRYIHYLLVLISYDKTLLPSYINPKFSETISRLTFNDDDGSQILFIIFVFQFLKNISLVRKSQLPSNSEDE